MEFSTVFPGFRFSPTDGELISHYLKRKIDGLDKCDDVIPEVEICKHEPWDLPAKSIIKSDREWFFFSPSGRKYPNGSQARRATEVGFWKATGKERGIKSGSTVIGTKRTLVFHVGRAPKGERTEWIMHEYCIKGSKVDKHQDTFVVCRIRKKHDFSGKKESHNCDSDSDGTQAGMEMLHDGNAAGCSSNNQKSGLDSHSNQQPDEICIPHLDSGINQEVWVTLNIVQTDKLKPLIVLISDSNTIYAVEGVNICKNYLKFQDRSDEDCFADILKDDIIKLDDTSPYIALSQSSVAAQKPEIPRSSDESGLADIPQINNRQGTAHRRIRMKMHKSEPYSAKKHGISSIIQEDTNYPVKVSRNKSSYLRAIFGLIFMGSVIISLLVSFLLMYRGALCFKSFENFRL